MSKHRRGTHAKYGERAIPEWHDKSQGRKGLLPSGANEKGHDENEIEFLKAMDRYKRERNRPFPTCSEILAVLRSLGYRRVAEPEELPRPNR